ncbi:MAG: DUF2190 family protein [Phycisphaerae bacterium]|nr:DUF2190 family protein [Phycisphaerae bacterium]
MSQRVEGPTKTFTAGAALAQYRRVRLDSGKLAYAGASDSDGVGVLENATFADGDAAAVRLPSAEGTQKMVAAGAFSAGAGLYAAANGKVDDSGTVPVGIALEASGADGDIVEVLHAEAMPSFTLARSSMTQEDLSPYPLQFEQAKVWDAPQTNIPGTPATDDLGLIDNTFLTGAPTIETGDLKAAGATTRKTRISWPVPPEYVAGQTITLRLNAGMKTTVADTSATIDAQVARRAAPNTDICATAAQSINSLTAANKDFTITPTNVVPGDILDIVLAIAVTDAATGTAVIGQLNSATILADIKG